MSTPKTTPLASKAPKAPRATAVSVTQPTHLPGFLRFIGFVMLVGTITLASCQAVLTHS